MALKDFHLWQQPTHHENLKEQEEDIYWVELFYDLIHVVSIFLMGNFLSHHLSVEWLWYFIFFFIAFWVAWGDFAFYNSMYVSRDVKHRILMIFQVSTIMVMSAAIPDFFDGGYLYFMGAYAVNRFLLAVLYLRAQSHDTTSKTLSKHLVRNFLWAALITASALLFPVDIAIGICVFWIILLQLSYITPNIWAMSEEWFRPRFHHLSERFSLFFLICVGEGFFKLVTELANTGITQVSSSIFLHYILGAFGLFLLAWIYFDFVGNRIANRPVIGNMIAWWYGHMILMMSVVMIGVALMAEIHIGFLDPYPVWFGLLWCLGMILYILSLWLIHRIVGWEISHRFYTLDVRIFGLFCALSTAVVVIVWLPSMLGNMLYFIGLLSQIGIPMIRAYSEFRDS